MKKLVPLAALIIVLISSNISFGQTEAGALYIRGGSNMNMGISSAELSDDSKLKTRSFNISPSIRYFVVDNLAIGLSLGYSFSSSRTDDTRNSFNSFGVGPSATYFFGKTNIKPFIATELGYNRSYTKNTIFGDVNKGVTDNLNLNLGGGVAFFVQERIAIDLGLYYNPGNLLNSNNQQSSISLNLGLNIKLN